MTSLRVIPERCGQAGAREGVTHRALRQRYLLVGFFRPRQRPSRIGHTGSSQPRHPLLPPAGELSVAGPL